MRLAPTLSTLPFGDETDFDMGYCTSVLAVFGTVTVLDLCVNVLVRPPPRQAPTRISPRRSGAARPCSIPPGGARQDLTVGYVLQSVQRRPGRVPGFTGAYHHSSSPYTVHLCLWMILGVRP